MTQRGKDEMSIELDRTASGGLRANVVSIANLIALIALLGTAFTSFSAFRSQVDTMQIRVEAASKEISTIRSDLQSNLAQRDADLRELRSKTENIANRMSIIETKANSMVTTIERVEQKIDKLSPTLLK
jgi:chromosome segregation ATPase